MSKKWNEKDIERALKRMPEIKDHRSAEDILNRLKEDDRLQEQRQRKLKLARWIPVAIAVAALVFMSVILPSMFKKNDAQLSQTADVVQFDESNEVNKEVNESENHAFSVEETNSYVVQAEALEDHVKFQVGLVSGDQMIPVSLLIPINEVQADFPNEQPTSFQLYEKYAKEIPEEGLGLTAYHPYNGGLSIEGKTIIHHSEKDAEEENPLYEQTIRETFADFDTWRSIRGEDVISEIHLVEDSVVYSYYKYTSPMGQSYLVKEAQAGRTVEEALMNMTKSSSSIVEALIADEQPYDIAIKNNIAHIQFSEGLDLLTMDEEDAVLLIEGFMLTASEFGVAVHFENISPATYGQYELFRPLPIPVGSNPINLSFN